ncbi:hypothetical protein [Hymenobacter glacieicola]|uniref:hypothetical protein n=1 Tax=Hymenobacter glacieicola TaxID=1562124 RepID=UPI00166A46FE|nr:hypothetical protein [Hymenobacter glacieicola]
MSSSRKSSTSAAGLRHLHYVAQVLDSSWNRTTGSFIMPGRGPTLWGPHLVSHYN